MFVENDYNNGCDIIHEKEMPNEHITVSPFPKNIRQELVATRIHSIRCGIVNPILSSTTFANTFEDNIIERLNDENIVTISEEENSLQKFKLCELYRPDVEITHEASKNNSKREARLVYNNIDKVALRETHGETLWKLRKHELTSYTGFLGNIASRDNDFLSSPTSYTREESGPSEHGISEHHSFCLANRLSGTYGFQRTRDNNSIRNNILEWNSNGLLSTVKKHIYLLSYELEKKEDIKDVLSKKNDSECFLSKIMSFINSVIRKLHDNQVRKGISEREDSTCLYFPELCDKPWVFEKG